MIKFIRDNFLGQPSTHNDGRIYGDDGFGTAVVIGGLISASISLAIFFNLSYHNHLMYAVGIPAAIPIVGYFVTALIKCRGSHLPSGANDRMWAILIGFTWPGFAAVIGVVGSALAIFNAGKFVYKFHENVSTFQDRRQEKKRLAEDKVQRIISEERVRIAKQEEPKTPFRSAANSCGECGRPNEEQWDERDETGKPFIAEKIKRGTIGTGPH